MSLINNPINTSTSSSSLLMANGEGVTPPGYTHSYTPQNGCSQLTPANGCNTGCNTSIPLAVYCQL